MTNTVTINIQNNCGCPGGSQGYSGSNGGDIINGSWEEIPVPGGEDAPPAGYLTATSVTDRQCKVAIFTYQWVYYFTDTLANTTQGNIYLNFAASSVWPDFAKTAVSRVMLPLVVAASEALATFGIEISDAVLPLVSFVIASNLIGFLTEFIDEHNLTPEKVGFVFSKLPDMQDQIICVLSKGTTENVKEDLAALLKEPVFDLSEDQQEYIILMTSTMSKMLYYTPEWWPGFDTETLSSITANCCGSFTDGTALLPSSTEGCQTSWYIVDKLIQAIQGISEYYSSWFFPGGDGNASPNLLADPVDRIYEGVKMELPPYIPYKVRQRASDSDGLYRSLALYIEQQISTVLVIVNFFDYNWSNLANELSAQSATIRTNLQAALDVNDVYDAIYTPLETWLDANVTDADLNTYMKNVINALIQPTGSTGDYLNMMFYQDADLATYAAADCSGTVDPAADSPSAQCGADTAIGTYDFSLGQYNWSASGHLCNPVYDAALGEFRAATWDPGRGAMTLTQGVSHNVQSMTVYYRGPAGGSGSISAGNVGNVRQTKTVSGGTGSVTFTNLCITNNIPVFTAGMIANGTDAWIAITEIEFHQ